jgi:hypothetical protein
VWQEPADVRAAYGHVQWFAALEYCLWWIGGLGVEVSRGDGGLGSCGERFVFGEGPPGGDDGWSVGVATTTGAGS